MPLDHIHIGRFAPGGGLESGVVPLETIRNIANQQTNKYWFASQFLKYWMIRLDGRTRFDLTNDQATGDLLARPETALAQLFARDEIRKDIREFIYDAFGLYFVIDPMAGGRLRIRLSQTPPTGDEQSLNQNAREFHRAATYIKEASDGVQAYVGIITSVMSGEHRLTLIDEPEAFLHPPLARKLGYQLASISKNRKGALIASTHSADFLIGCIQASSAVRVVRLEYSNNKSKGNVVDPALLEVVFKSPLLRSANVISALFHDGVVVTESDNDRAFYSEIYYRLAESETGLPALLFVNAQNKQTMKDIISPLRKFGIPAAAIADVDILKDGGKVWTGWLHAAQIPEALHDGYANQRHKLLERFVESGKEMKRGGGIGLLSVADQKAASQLFDLLDSYGVFAVRNGELENWLPELGAVGYKTDWTISALEKMGSDRQVAVMPGRQKTTYGNLCAALWLGFKIQVAMEQCS